MSELLHRNASLQCGAQDIQQADGETWNQSTTDVNNSLGTISSNSLMLLRTRLSVFTMITNISVGSPI